MLWFGLSDIDPSSIACATKKAGLNDIWPRIPSIGQVLGNSVESSAVFAAVPVLSASESGGRVAVFHTNQRFATIQPDGLHVTIGARCSFRSPQLTVTKRDWS